MNGNRNNSARLLNPNQKKSLMMSLRVLEEMLNEIEFTISRGPVSWITYEMSGDGLPAPVKNEIIRKVSFIREEIRETMEEFALMKRARRATGDVIGKLSSAWEILEGAKAKHLSGYGTVAEGLTGRLDPRLDKIIALVDEIRNLVSGK
jgi:hypothetical protein